MGIFDFSKSKGGGSDAAYIKKEATYKLTPDGESKVKTYTGEEREYAVMGALIQLGPAPATIAEIDELAHMGHSKVKRVLDVLISTGRAVKSGDRTE